MALSTQIKDIHFARAITNWAYPKVHAMYLSPFFAVHEAQRFKAIQSHDQLRIWIWDNERAVRKCLEIIWQLTGEWKARRGIAVSSRARFDKTVAASVRRLAKVLNTYSIASLQSASNLTGSKYRRVISSIEEETAAISGVRPTKTIQPVLGSKVLHHFFPSVVPVFDDKLISKRVLRHNSFMRFLHEESSGWLFNDYGKEMRMQEYHHYLGYSAEQIYHTDGFALKHLRCRLGKLYSGLCPLEMVRDKKSLLWKLDAKLSEYCLIGSTFGRRKHK